MNKLQNDIKMLPMSKDMEHSLNLKCPGCDSSSSASRNAVGYSKDNDGYVIVFDCMACGHTYYFHPLTTPDKMDFGKFHAKYFEYEGRSNFEIKTTTPLKETPGEHTEWTRKEFYEKFHSVRAIVQSTNYFFSEKMYEAERFLKDSMYYANPEHLRQVSYYFSPNQGEFARRMKYEKFTDWDLLNIIKEHDGILGCPYKKKDLLESEEVRS